MCCVMVDHWRVRVRICLSSRGCWAGVKGSAVYVYVCVCVGSQCAGMKVGCECGCERVDVSGSPCGGVVGLWLVISVGCGV
jgi:hypothetical protein